MLEKISEILEASYWSLRYKLATLRRKKVYVTDRDYSTEKIVHLLCGYCGKSFNYDIRLTKTHKKTWKLNFSILEDSVQIPARSFLSYYRFTAGFNCTCCNHKIHSAITWKVLRNVIVLFL